MMTWPGTRTGRQSRRMLLALVGGIAGVSLIAACSGSPAPTPRKTSPSTSSGVTSGTTAPGGPSATGQTPFGAKWDWGRFDPIKPYLNELAGGRTFYELAWCDVVPSQGASPNWRQIDKVVKNTNAVGMTMMLKIRVGQCWATGGTADHARGAKNKTESLMPRSMSDYSTFVHDLVTRYAAMGVHEYAVENEINGQTFWAGTPQDYASLATVAAKAIRAADPEAVVVDPGISSTAYGAAIASRLLAQGKAPEAINAWNDYYAMRFGARGDSIPRVSNESDLQSALAGDQAKRNLAYLAVAEQLATSGVFDVRQIHYYEGEDALPSLLDYLRATTPPKVRLEAWEVGSFVKGNKTPSAEASTLDVVQKTSLMLAAGVGLVIWLPLNVNSNGQNADEPRTGLLNGDGSDRPQGKAFAAMAADARGATAAPVSVAGLSGVTFTRAGASVAYLWADGAAVRTAAGAGDVTPLDGSSGAVTSISSAMPVRIAYSGSLDQKVVAP